MTPAFPHLPPLRPCLHRLSLLAIVMVAMTLAACGPNAVGTNSGADNNPSGGDSPYLGNLLADALPKPAFGLTDTSGRPYDFASETEGYVTLVYFGYTYCPDVCPDHMANIAAALQRLPADIAQQVKVVFVTVDPDRDTPQRLRQWLDLFDPSFVGLTGSNQEIDAALREALRDLYFPVTREDLGGGQYSVSHASFVLAYTQDNMAHIVYPFGFGRDSWEQDIRKLVTEGWKAPAASAAPTPTPAPASTAASTPGGEGAARRPRRLTAQEALPLLGAEYSKTTLDDVRAAIELAFQRHPDAVRFMSQGLTIPREKLDLEVRICGSRPQNTADASLLACSTLGGCARLTRILYDYYFQSGYEEFYRAALAVFNYVSTALPNEADAFFYLLRSELRVSGLPAG